MCMLPEWIYQMRHGLCQQDYVNIQSVRPLPSTVLAHFTSFVMRVLHNNSIRFRLHLLQRYFSKPVCTLPSNSPVVGNMDVIPMQVSVFLFSNMGHKHNTHQWFWVKSSRSSMGSHSPQSFSSWVSAIQILCPQMTYLRSSSARFFMTHSAISFPESVAN